MRPVWQGALSFGLVNVPVRLYRAVEDHAVHFTQFQRGTRDRIRYRRVNERTGDEVKYDDIVRGREVGDDEYVLVEPEELDEIAPGRSRSRCRSRSAAWRESPSRTCPRRRIRCRIRSRRPTRR